MSTPNNVINISINISSPQTGESKELPLQIEERAVPNQLVVQKTTATAESILSRLEQGHHKMIVGTAKVSKKLLKKILLEIAPDVSLKIINLGVRLLVLIGV